MPPPSIQITDAGVAPDAADADADAGGAADASADAGAIEAAVPCDVTGSPATEACLVDDRYSVFVVKGAVGTGTKATPTGSISAALAVARQSGLSHVIVCNDTYTETVALDAMQGKVAIDGGFACPMTSGSSDAGAGWHYAPGQRTVIAPLSGPALTINGAVGAVTLSDLELRSAAGVPGGSSIAAVVTGSVSVTLRRDVITAGAGGVGAAGIAGVAGIDGLDASLTEPPYDPICSNPPATLPGGRWTTSTACGSLGGKGGDAFLNGAGEAGQSGSPQQNLVSTILLNGGAAGTNTKQPGKPGNKGSAGTDGDPGVAASASGALSATGYTSADGNAGSDGHTGQGGGGGGGSLSTATCVAGSGGVGGMGGCGGTHGTGGHGGGASIAMIVWDSGVTLVDTSLHSSNGGAAGNGGDAGSGGLGKIGTAPPDSVTQAVPRGGPGGKGGDGGNAGSGSGGSGGPSYALVFHGTKPVELGMTTLTSSPGGAAGHGGAVGTARLAPAPDGAIGVSAARFQVTP
jgi:CBS domain-containing protein